MSGSMIRTSSGDGAPAAAADTTRDSAPATVPLTRGRLGWIDLVRRTRREIGKDHVSAFAGNLAYHAMLALFPFAIFVLSLLFVAGQEQLLVDAIAELRDTGALSAGAADVVTTQVEDIAASHSGPVGFGLVLSILTALWATSGAFRSVMEATNIMYDVDESRGLVRRYAMSVVLSIVVAALFVTALALVVAGPAGAALLGDVGRWTWLVLQWPVLFGLVLFALALMYYFAPDVQQEFRWVTQGSIIAAVAWLAFSLLFSLYVNSFGSYNATYGALAGVIVLLLYTYYTSFIFLFGAEVNQVIEDASPSGKDEGERS